ncbi:MAG TPA: hypothetical protein VN688_26925 [Gemmataceae bacterium]|nr:hypothetical protein [Gemmataceae bacterium]
MIAYEQRLNQDVWWAFQEGSMHFEQASAVHKTLVKIAQRLDALSIPYAIASGMALFFHGYRRFTEDVDILVTREGLQEIHAHLEGLGYLPPFEGSKNLRDTESGVRIEFLVTDDYPGDGKPKPVAFPSPEAASQVIAGVRCLQLPHLVELKLVEGTTPGRRKDLGDVQELIRLLHLPEDYATQLNPMVQALYRELWQEVQNSPSPS